MSVPALRFKDEGGLEFPAWEQKQLGEMAIINPKSNVLPRDFVYIDLESVEKGILLKETHVSKDDAPSRAQRKLEKEDVLFQMVRPYQGNNLFFDKSGDYVASTGYAQIRAYENSRFIYHLLHLENFVGEVMNRCTGTSYPAINANDLATIEVQIPCLTEQAKIANFLTAVDKKITQLTQKHELLIQYKKGLMQKIFSQELRFKDDDGGNFPNWEQQKLGDISSFFSGGTPLTTNKSFYNGDVAFIKSGEIGATRTEQFITEAGLNASSAKMVKTGDLLYALYGATSGEVAISKINGAINQAVLCIRSKLNTYYLYSYLRFQKSAILGTYLQGGQGNLSAEIIRSLNVPFPCEKEQTKIANFLTAVDEKINTAHSQLEAVKQYKQALLQQMFV